MHEHSSLYLLACTDTINRLNTLILEARHLQENLIYTLRSPVLYRPLKCEEKHLWLETSEAESFCAGSKLGSMVQLKREVDEMAEKNVRLFPRPDIIHGGNDLFKIHTFATGVLGSSRWSNDQKRHYYNLYAIQILKRVMYSDKLLLAKASMVILRKQVTDKAEFCRIMILRAGIMHRIKGYVKRLGDHQDEYSRSQDMALQDHPRPSMTRRREQRVYTSFLSQRCVDVWEESRLFLEEEFQVAYQRNLKFPPIMHRWQHHYSSYSYTFVDDIAIADSLLKAPESIMDSATPYLKPKRRKSRPAIPYADKIESHNLHYISTSYFMPERPDLQSVMVHEVVHAVLRDVYDDLSNQRLMICNDEFSRLIKLLRQCLDVSGVSEAFAWAGRPLIKEIAVDLICASLRGASYLYSFFLEAFGDGVSELLFSGSESMVDLRMLDDLQGGAGQFGFSLGWYIRLHVLCAWMTEYWDSMPNSERSTHPVKLGRELVGSMSTAADDMLDHLVQLAPGGNMFGQYWARIKNRMTKLVRMSEAPQQAGEWAVQVWTKSCPRGQHRPSSMRPLPTKLRRYVLDNIIEVKKSKVDDDALMSRLNSISNMSEREFEQKGLYRFLYDIPWQSALLNAECSLNHGQHARSADLIRTLHSLHNPAYQVAMEFQLQLGDTPRHRLGEVVRILTDEYSKIYLDKICHEEKALLEEWLGGQLGVRIKDTSCDGPDVNIDAYLDLFISGSYWLKWAQWYLLSRCSAIFLIIKFYKEDDKGRRGVLTKLMGHKLNQLKTIIDGIDTEGLLKFLAPLKVYLDTHKGTDFYEKVIEAISEKSDDERKLLLPQNTLGRSAVGAVYRLFEEKRDRSSRFDLEEVHNNSGTEKRRMDSLIGRYDMFLHGPGYAPQQYLLDFSKATNQSCSKNEKCDEANSRLCGKNDECDKLCSHCSQTYFLPYFVRWQMASPIRLTDISWKDCCANHPEPGYRPHALVSITLRHSTARLPFICRLLDVSRKEFTGQIDDNPHNVESLAGYFVKGDRAFLSDGWEDLLLILVEDEQGQVSGVERAFRIQKALFEDFQVDRTELIFTPRALDEVLESDDLRLRILFRVLDDWGINPADETFKEAVFANWKGGEGFPFDIDLSRTPGRMDFSMRVKDVLSDEILAKFKKAYKTESKPLFSAIVSLIRGTRCDRIQTNIGLLERE